MNSTLAAPKPIAEKELNFTLHCKHVLENDPAYSSQLKKIYLWQKWSNKQRAVFKKGNLEKERIDKLNDIGFV